MGRAKRRHQPACGKYGLGFGARARAEQSIRLGSRRERRAPDHAALIPVLQDATGKGHGGVLFCFQCVIEGAVENSQHGARSRDFKERTQNAPCRYPGGWFGPHVASCSIFNAADR